MMQEMKQTDSEVQSVRVYEVMSHPVVTAHEDEELKSVAIKMLKRKIGSVIITDKTDNWVGIITQGDIVRCLATSAPNVPIYSMKAKELMSAPLISVEGDKLIEEAARVMVDSKIKKLCVRDADGNMVGMITDNDIMKNSGELIDVLMGVINTGYVES